MNIATIEAIKAERERDTHSIVDGMEEPIDVVRNLTAVAVGLLDRPESERDHIGAIAVVHAIMLLTEKLEEDRTEVLKRLHASERAAA